MKLVISVLIIGLIAVFLFSASAPTEMRAPLAAPASTTPAPVRTYAPGREPIPYPEAYRTRLVHYATVDRSDAVTRLLYISPEAVQAARAGQMIPYGTFVVIEAYDAERDVLGQPRTDASGRWIAGALRTDEIHVGERRSTWYIEDLRANTNFDGWNFRAFEFETGTPIDRELNECFSCHDNAFDTEFLFSRRDLYRYAATGDVQYRYCPAPERVICR